VSGSAPIAGGVPAAFALGRASFMGVELLVAKGVLVPREETELLGKTSLAALAALGAAQAPRLVDMCCGSGNLACALARHLPAARVWAADLTDDCVGLARRNAAHAGVAERVSVHQGDLFGALAGLGLEGTLDAVICNPPYISQGKLAGESAPLLEHEPREAFDGGPYGLSIQQRVVRDAAAFLRPGGTLLFELGLGQERQMKILFDRTGAYEAPQFTQNAAGEVRVASARRRAG
jgi:release factor glutamine methyltransferase